MNDNLFQNEEVQEVLFERAKSSENSVCVSGETVDGVHKRYSSEYLEWNLMAMWAKVAICLTEDERKQWFIDNPPPVNKFEG